MIRIFINGLAAKQGGGVTYLNELLRQFALRRDVEIDIYGFLKIDKIVLENAQNINNIEIEYAHSNIFTRLFYERLIFPLIIMARKYDVAFFPSGMITGFVPKSTKSITMFRNMLPFSDENIIKFEKTISRLRYYLLKILYLHSYRSANHVIFISEYGKKIIKTYINNIEEKSSIIPHGISDRFKIKKCFKNDGYLLYVSILNEYKHQIEVVKGLSLFKKKYGYAPTLKLAGYIKEDYATRLRKVIINSDLQKEVEILGPIEHVALPELYKDAKIVVFASTCENCPNILLESMAMNSAILCSQSAPMAEFLKDAGYYFDSECPESFAEILGCYINQNDQLGEKADQAFREASKYSWKKTAHETIELFYSV